MIQLMRMKMDSTYSKTSLESTSPRPCALCTGSFTGFGNKPQPVLENYEDRVCDDCNWNIVIPARIRSFEND